MPLYMYRPRPRIRPRLVPRTGLPPADTPTNRPRGGTYLYSSSIRTPLCQSRTSALQCLFPHFQRAAAGRTTRHAVMRILAVGWSGTVPRSRSPTTISDLCLRLMVQRFVHRIRRVRCMGTQVSVAGMASSFRRHPRPPDCQGRRLFTQEGLRLRFRSMLDQGRRVLILNRPLSVAIALRR